jgi:hypothetical protein
MKYLLITFLLIGCGSFKNAGQENQDISGDLLLRQSTYISLAKGQQDANGFIHTDKCDSLLFSTLLAVARGEQIVVTAAKSEEGQWYRRPTKDCLATGSSKSTISRDMFMGLFLYLQHFNQAQEVVNLWNYGEDNTWNMGQAVDTETEIGRTIFTPNTIGLLARVRHQLTGREVVAQHLPTAYSTDEGFTSHLSMLSILIDSKARGAISDSQLDTLKEIRDNQPGNALAQAMVARFTDGDFTTATQLLLDKFPADRLPTTDDWCEEWIVQRGDNESSINTPCEGSHTHSGGDFLFVAAIITNQL